MLTVTAKTGKIQKQVFIIRRIEVVRGEHVGRIIHVVRSVKREKGQLVEHNYQVITFGDQDGRVTCDYPASGDCCHKIEVASYDMRRCNSIAPVKARQEASLLEQVNAELAKVQAEPTTAEELAATQAKLLLPNVDQAVYFVQHNRRAAECHNRSTLVIAPVPTPIVRNVSQDWLLNGNCGGTFSGRAEEVA